MLNILLIEDEFIIAKDIQFMLQKNDFSKVDLANDIDSAKSLFVKNKYDLIISDINLNTSKDGIETIKELSMIKKVPVVYLTAYSDKKTIKRAENTMPFAYLLKPFNFNQLVITIRLAIQNFQKLSNDIFQVNPENKSLIEQLTNREKEILVVLASGKMYKETAVFFNISSRTVEKHIENIKKKLSLRTSGELINFTMTSKLLSVNINEGI